MSRSFGDLASRLERVADSLTGPGRAKVLARAGEELKPLVAEAVKATPSRRGTLGDGSMSGWPRRNPAEIAGRWDLKGDDLEVSPERKARGPLRVLESGRQSYAAGDRRKSGTRVRKKDGVRVDKTRVVKRNTASTAGKGTWSAAEAAIAAKAPVVLDREKVAALAREFRRG